ncbi:MAG: sensor domain-containing diguanylate cyclase [Spirochaetes bacterium]|nr:sensor domain-containing diguanylate cyclase [Spirochaetota bacterium]
MEKKEEISDNAVIEKLNNKITDLKSLLEIGLIIASEQKLENISKEIIYGLITKFKPEYILIVFFPDEINQLPQYYAYKNFQPLEKDIKITDFSQIVDFFLSHPNQLDFSTFSFLIPSHIINEFVPFKPEIVFPIKTIESVFGMILFSAQPDNKKYSQEDIEYISTIINFASIAIQNKKNYLKAITDLKTGLFIYHYLIQRLIEEIEKYKRYNEIFSFIIMDIDNFKMINDKYGHVTGDFILIQLARIISESIRKNIDLPVRYGGEEFSILLPRCDSFKAYEISERIRKKVENSSFYYDNKLIKFTISAGVCSIEKKDITPNDFIELADKALYYAKKTGKNKTIVNKNNKFIVYKINEIGNEQNKIN